MTSFSKLDPVTQEEIILYVGEEKYNRSYKKRWDSMDRRSSKLSWNWSSFFANVYWASYRKMNVWAYGYIAVVFLIDLITSLFNHKGQGVFQLLEFVAFIPFAIFSNYIYLQQAIKTVKKLKVDIPGQEERRAYLQKTGGGSKRSFWLFLIIGFVVGCIERFTGLI